MRNLNSKPIDFVEPYLPVGDIMESKELTLIYDYHYHDGEISSYTQEVLVTEASLIETIKAEIVNLYEDDNDVDHNNLEEVILTVSDTEGDNNSYTLTVFFHTNSRQEMLHQLDEERTAILDQVF